MFVSGGWEAVYITHKAFEVACIKDPTTMHAFMDQRLTFIKLKNENPVSRVRSSSQLCPQERVVVAETAEMGLEAPDEFFVMLDEYTKESDTQILMCWSNTAGQLFVCARRVQ